MNVPKEFENMTLDDIKHIESEIMALGGIDHIRNELAKSDNLSPTYSQSDLPEIITTNNVLGMKYVLKKLSAESDRILHKVLQHVNNLPESQQVEYDDMIKCILNDGKCVCSSMNMLEYIKKYCTNIMKVLLDNTKHGDKMWRLFLYVMIKENKSELFKYFFVKKFSVYDFDNTPQNIFRLASEMNNVECMDLIKKNLPNYDY